MAVTYLTGATDIEVDPISRIEGHLGVKLDTDANGFVNKADVHGNLWRGFENFLIGREPNDAITFVQRICGVCPVPHGTTSLYAVEAVYGYNDNFQTFSTLTDAKGVPPKAMYIRNLVLSAEFLMSSITHFYHLAAPSYVQGPAVPPWTPYWDDSYYHPLLISKGHGAQGDGSASTSGQQGALPLNAANGFSKDLWSAVIKQYVKALRIRRLTFEAGAMFAGRMPMTSAWIAGGVSTDNTADLQAKCQKFHDMIVEVGVFVASEYVPTLLALGALYPNFDNFSNADLLNTAAAGLWQLAGQNNATEAPSSGNTGWGAGVGNFISWGGFPNTDGTLGTPRGYYLKGGATGAITSGDVLANLREHVTHSRYEYTTARAIAAGYSSGGVSDPATVNRTIPKRDGGATQYSWLKAPRWTVSGNPTPMEVGPLACMMVSGVWRDDETTYLKDTIPGFSAYLKTVTGSPSGVGVDPAMINPDLAVALVVTGLAALQLVGGILVDNGTSGTNISSLPTSGIVAAYYAPNAIIVDAPGQYPLVSYILGLKSGISTIDRLRARAVQSLVLVQKMIGAVGKSSTSPTFPALDTTGTGSRPAVAAGWLQQLMWESKAPVSGGAIKATWNSKTTPTGLKTGFGATEAPRGALMHFCTIDGGKITAYQCVVPTTWNAGPKDVNDANGPMEESMMRVPYSAQSTAFTTSNGTAITAGGGVEAMRVAQSFDPCIACAVH